MNQEFILALDQIEKEKGIKKKILVEAVEAALVNAYKKNFGAANNVRVSIDPVKGDIRVLSRKNIVNKKEYELLDGEISLEGAQEIDLNYQVGDVIEEEVTPRSFGRIAAQTARQMVVQKIKEASRDIVYEEFSKRVGDMVIGEVSRKGKGSKGNTQVSLSIIGESGITVVEEGILSPQEQIPGEEYTQGQRLNVYILEVKRQNNVPKVLVSRSHPGLVKRLFEREVPEISDGIVQIRSISREAGSRTKMAVWSVDPEVDPIGACVGTRGTRVAEIVEELNGEKIDIILYSDDPVKYISNALSPSKVLSVDVWLQERSARVIVPDYQISLAIGREGQNARLAARLTNWKIDIRSEQQAVALYARESYEDEVAKESVGDVLEEQDDERDYEAKYAKYYANYYADGEQEENSVKNDKDYEVEKAYQEAYAQLDPYAETPAQEEAEEALAPEYENPPIRVEGAFENPSMETFRFDEEEKWDTPVKPKKKKTKKEKKLEEWEEDEWGEKAPSLKAEERAYEEQEEVQAEEDVTFEEEHADDLYADYAEEYTEKITKASNTKASKKTAKEKTLDEKSEGKEKIKAEKPKKSKK